MGARRPPHGESPVMPTNIVQGVPTDIVQSGLLQRVFHDMLVSTFIYRLEGTAEKWEANLGANLVMTRPGPIPVDVTPVTGKDLNPTTFSYEQWQKIGRASCRARV